jgi:Zinc binding domain
MNKAFTREPDSRIEYCPRCGSAGQLVGIETVEFYLSKETQKKVADPANFCPSPRCEVVYFDAFERVLLKSDLDKPVYPKDPNAPICACFGLTGQDIKQDVSEGVVTRVKAILEKANSPEARCAIMAANGQCCVAYVQKYYMQCKESAKSEE